MKKVARGIFRKEKKISKLHFKHFPRFAQYLLDNKLNEFVEVYLDEMFSIQLPALKYFDTAYTKEQLFELSVKHTTDYFKYIIENRLEEHLNDSVKKWINNQLPVITRDQIVIEDITKTVYLRKAVFLKFIPEYIADTKDAIDLIREIDDYLLATETTSFNAFINIQREKMIETNQILQRHEDQLLEAQELAGLGSFEWDLTGEGKSYFTPQLYKIFDMQVSGNLPDFLTHVHPCDREKLQNAIDKSLRGEGDYECEYRYIKNGKEKVIWSRGIVIRENKKPSVMKGTVMDVTDRYYMVDRLQRSEELHKQAQALTHIGNWSWDIKKNKIEWSDELYRIYGLEPQSEKITFERFFSFVHPEDREARKRQIQTTLNTNTVEDYVLRIITADGKTRYIQGRGNVQVDADNKPYKLLGTCQDITENIMLNEERNKLYIALQEKNKELEKSNKELASFNYVTSHDLQEPLRKIKIFSSRILETDYNHLSENGKRYFDRIQSSANQMQNFIDDLLVFSNTQAHTNIFEPVEITVVMDEIKKFYAEPAGKKSPVIEYENTLPVINAVPFQIRQLFMNIVSNAVKYSKENCVAHIRVTSEIVEGKQVRQADANKAKKYYKIRIRDNGIGFEQEHADKIFEVFQRLHDKRRYPGTGIGLSICKKIAENHNGFITAFGQVNQGATFDIYLPVNR